MKRNPFTRYDSTAGGSGSGFYVRLSGSLTWRNFSSTHTEEKFLFFDFAHTQSLITHTHTGAASVPTFLPLVSRIFNHHSIVGYLHSSFLFEVHKKYHYLTCNDKEKLWLLVTSNKMKRAHPFLGLFSRKEAWSWDKTLSNHPKNAKYFWMLNRFHLFTTTCSIKS